MQLVMKLQKERLKVKDTLCTYTEKITLFHSHTLLKCVYLFLFLVLFSTTRIMDTLLFERNLDDLAITCGVKYSYG